MVSYGGPRAWLGVVAAAVLAAQVMAAQVREGYVKRGDYPYQVAVVPYSNPEDVHVCGGSLLAAKWVLSSASCVNYCRDASAHARRVTGLGSGPSGSGSGPSVGAAAAWDSPPIRDVGRCNTFLRVILGAVSLTHDEPEQKWFTVADAVSHPDTKSDLILLRLNKRVAFSDYIQPVSLAGKSASDLADMRLTGWGSAENVNLSALSLLATKANKYSSFVCSTAFLLEDLQSYNFCGFQNTCAADAGGSPVVVRDGESLVQVALTSGTFARQCDRIYPTLFVRLDPFVDWIRATIGAERY